jgi:hypothetical protein
VCRSGNAYMTLGRQDMAETRRVERTRTGEKHKGQKPILKPGMQQDGNIVYSHMYPTC